MTSCPSQTECGDGPSELTGRPDDRPARRHVRMPPGVRAAGGVPFEPLASGTNLATLDLFGAPDQLPLVYLLYVDPELVERPRRQLALGEEHSLKMWEMMDEDERGPVSETVHVAETFSSRHLEGDDFEVIPTPGHTSGATAFLWDSGRHRVLRTDGARAAQHLRLAQRVAQRHLRALLAAHGCAHQPPARAEQQQHAGIDAIDAQAQQRQQVRAQ